jgi:hypothetical protein
MNTNTPETEAFAQSGKAHYMALNFARKLERERDEALAKLSAVFQWLNRNHPDGFIDSLTHLQNLERVSDVQHDRLDRLERERNEAQRKRDIYRDQLCRICKDGFNDQDTIGLEPADDYVLRKLAELRQALSGRTVSCSNCNESARTIVEMREAINGVSKILQSIQLNDIFEETMRNHAVLALAKLQPFLK